jgi:6-phosphogluconolactonase (cycloisomerase 2 family)
MHHASVFKVLTALTIAAGLLPTSAQSRSEGRQQSLDTVYTMSNDPSGNAVLAFKQRPDARLVPWREFATGGSGTGGGLGNQGALAGDGDFLFVVNPGSDDVSVFRARRSGLELVDRTSSGGVRPVSITVDRDLVYVLNAGSDSIAGFTVGHSGRLDALPGSEQPLSGTGVDPAQIQFSQDGRTLIVTEKATNRLVTFSLNHAGIPTRRQLFASPGPTPFGFALGRARQVIVSEAAGGAANASSVTSYRIARDGALNVLDAAVPTHQSAACWVAITPDGRFAYVTNTGSDTLSAYRVHANGQLTLLQDDGVAARVGPGSGAPIDMSFSDQGELLHVLSSGEHTITTFRVAQFGQLTRVGEVSGLPVGTNGLIAF